MSQADHYERVIADTEPKVRRESGPFTERVKSVAEAVAFCKQRGLDPAEVTLAHNYLIWERVETAAEVSERIENARRSLSTHLARIDEMHREYTERGLYAHPEQQTSADVRTENTPATTDPRVRDERK